MASDNVRELVRNANEDQWEQVLILSAGQGNESQTSDLLGGLLEQSVTGKTLRKMRLLAVACKGEIRSAQPDALAALEEVIPKLVPPRSISEAVTLSAVGESIIPFLARLRRSDVEQNAAIIRTAALVGGLKAMKLIANLTERHEFYDGEGLGTYIDPGDFYGELMRAWEYFDPSEYAEIVLKVSGLEALTVQDMRLIRYLDQLPFITSITLEASDSVLDLSPLDSLPALESLTLFGSDTESLTDVFHNWPSLTDTNLSSCDQLTDISALQMYSEKLQYLQISYCSELRDYSVISQLSSLRVFWLQGQENFDLSILSELTHLQDVTICECSVVDLASFADKDMTITVFDDTEIIGTEGRDFRPTVNILESTR